MNLTDEWLDRMRRRTDPLADQVIRDLFAQQPRAEVQAFFEQLIRQIEMPLGQMPPRTLAFFSEASTWPAWADFEKLYRAEQVFLDHGPKFLLLLYFKSLPTLYLCAQGAQVLALTGRLSPGREGHEVFARRVAETGQFMLYVMDRGGLNSCGPGLHSLLRVRLIHAAIRQFLPPDRWNPSWGRPINQEDLALTLMTFSVSMVEGMEQLGLALSEAEAEAYCHAWRVAGYFLGVVPELLPETLSQGQALLQTTLQRQVAPSAAGVQLTQALVDFAQQGLPAQAFDAWIPDLIAHFLGSERAAMLQLQPVQGCLNRMLPGFLQKFFGWQERLEDRHPALDQLAEQWSQALVQGMVQYFNTYKQQRFEVPQHMWEAWGKAREE